MLLAGGAVGFDVRSMWAQMGVAAKLVVVLLFLMSAYSIGIMIDRFLAYNSAKKQSRQFAPAVAGALREGKLDEAIKIAYRYKKSHLAKVVVAGLQEFRAHEAGADIPGEDVDASRRALERAEAITHAELKRGVSSLATIASSSPFVGLFGTVVGIINAFQGISTEKSTGLGAVAGGISEALVATALGLFVAVPAVWAYNYFTTRLEGLDVEMSNSSSELIDYFLKRSQRAAK
jgi:biopolymer transport protein ExbB/biopolymer transport protein TolQ